jgi:hypothetical protein
MKRTIKSNPRRILADVAPEQCFWVNNGPIVKNLRELPGALRRMKQDTFMHHVNKGKNDFSNWIKHVVGDAQLANSVSKMKTKKTMIDALNKRIKTLQKTAA